MNVVILSIYHFLPHGDRARKRDDVLDVRGGGLRWVLLTTVLATVLDFQYVVSSRISSTLSMPEYKSRRFKFFHGI